MKNKQSIIYLLESLGFKSYTKNEDSANIYAPERFQKRLDVEYPFSDYPVCHCNDKLFVDVYIYDFEIKSQSSQSVTFAFRAENSDGEWVDFSFYGLDFNKVDSKEDVIKYCLKLLNSWKSSF